MGKMSYYTDFWGMNYDICPCDVHVTDYLEARGVKDANVFHFGTGIPSKPEPPECQTGACR